MGLRCSILGHDYGDSTTEREREEQGGEVVVVERDLEICARCGTERVISENTEVRTLEQTESDDAADADVEQDVEEEPSFSEPTETSVAPGADTADTTDTSTPAEHAPPADEDDAIIMEDDPDAPRDRGQWPDEAQQEAMAETAETAEPEPTPWPDQDGEDEGFDAKPASETEADGDFDFAGGLTPESAEGGDPGEEGYVEAPTEHEEVTVETTQQSTSRSEPFSGSPPKQSAATEQREKPVDDTGFTSAGPVNPPSGSTDDGDSLLVCPECGFEREAARASLRAGDICPDCRKGYLAERR